MLFTKPSSVLLLQATAFFSGLTALSRPPCASNDDLLLILRSADACVSFCSAFLGVPVLTCNSCGYRDWDELCHAIEVTTEIDGTVTVTIPKQTTTVASVRRAAKRTLAYPAWLPTTYLAQRVSSACVCLSVPVSVATSTEAATLTASVIATEVTTSTLHSTISTTTSTNALASSTETSTTETSTTIAT
ncbi:hypothetical protein CONLIGDRAFT_691749 [Coniochaeta ligniaria NRRL 30616]|uniref:Uncharacterized protein n=1 Tax=Coniochaeta ligniaria NRRL 30616 TaxID=1408157 RepID=A0A1J7IAF0_9PEZI|nr:hypothetical protein CONLIGDRAFT_691749 [Coniochaeta ligniaria NRRL 30616]